MNGEFYASLLALSDTDREELFTMVSEDHFLEQVVDECAKGWRERCHRGGEPAAVRRLYLVRIALVAARYGCTHRTSRSVAAAFALTVCERVEERVSELAKAAEVINCWRKSL